MRRYPRVRADIELPLGSMGNVTPVNVKAHSTNGSFVGRSNTTVMTSSWYILCETQLVGPAKARHVVSFRRLRVPVTCR